MKKIIIMFLSVCMLLCITACNQNSTSSDSAKEIENITTDKNYTETLKLINEKEYEKAYKKINDIKDKKLAEELKSKFIVIENVLLSKTIIIPDDKLGNKIGPFTVKYSYDKNENLIEIDAKNIPVMDVSDAFNPFMKYVGKVNYFPYYEKLLYDDSNKLLTVSGYNSTLEKVIYTAKFTYDQNNRINKVVYIYDMGEEITFFKYDNDGLLKTIETSGDVLDKMKKIKNIDYDEKGNIIEEGTSYDNDGRVKESKCYYYSSGEYIEGKSTWNYGDFYIYNE